MGNIPSPSNARPSPVPSTRMPSCGNGSDVSGPVFREYTGEEYWSTADGVQDIHDLYCKKFLSKQVTIGGKTETISRGTSKLNTLEMTNFMESVKADVNNDFGIILPLPTDKYYSAFVAEYEGRY